MLSFKNLFEIVKTKHLKIQNEIKIKLFSKKKTQFYFDCKI